MNLLLSGIFSKRGKFLDYARKIQDLSIDIVRRKEFLDIFELEYSDWFVKGKIYVSEYSKTDYNDFCDQYIDEFRKRRIKTFFRDGLSYSRFFKEFDYPYQKIFTEPFDKQIEILSKIKEKNSVSDDVEILYSEIFEVLQKLVIEENFRTIIFYDLDQSYICFYAKAYKSCIITLGAALEGLMLANLRKPTVINTINSVSTATAHPCLKKMGYKNPTKTLEDDIADKLTFNDFKEILFWLYPSLGKLHIENIQHFRNSVHPWKNVSEPSSTFQNPSKARAIHYITAFNILIKEMEKVII
jgi:hypothetical protein